MGAFFTFLFLVILYGIYYATIKRGERELDNERKDCQIAIGRLHILSWFYFQEVMDEVYARLNDQGFSGEIPWSERFIAAGEMVYNGLRPAQEALRRAVVLMQSNGWGVFIHDDVNDIMKKDIYKTKKAPINMPAKECVEHILYYNLPDNIPEYDMRYPLKWMEYYPPYTAIYGDPEITHIVTDSLTGIIVHGEDVMSLKDLDPRTYMYQQQGTGKWCLIHPTIFYCRNPDIFQKAMSILSQNHIDQKYQLDLWERVYS